MEQQKKNPITGTPITPVILAPSVTVEPKKSVFLRPIPASIPTINAVWSIIKPYVEELAGLTVGEYSLANVYYELCHNLSQITLGFADSEEKNLIGFYISRLQPNSLHIWQAYMLPQYRNTPLVDEAYKEIEAEVKKAGIEFITFSAPRTGWHTECERFGFTEAYTIYRKSLK